MFAEITERFFFSDRPNNSLCRHASHTPPSQGKFIPGHRKTKSLGREIAFSSTVSFRSKPESSRTPKRYCVDKFAVQGI